MMERKLERTHITYSILSASFIFLVGSLGWIFILEGTWFDTSVLAPPLGIYIGAWVLVFALFACLLAITSIKHKLYSKHTLLHTLNVVLCVLYLYLFFFLNQPAQALTAAAIIILLSFFLFKMTLEESTKTALLMVPLIVWIAFLMVISYDLVLLG